MGYGPPTTTRFPLCFASFTVCSRLVFWPIIPEIITISAQSQSSSTRSSDVEVNESQLPFRGRRAATVIRPRGGARVLVPSNRLDAGKVQKEKSALALTRRARTSRYLRDVRLGPQRMSEGPPYKRNRQTSEPTVHTRRRLAVEQGIGPWTWKRPQYFPPGDPR